MTGKGKPRKKAAAKNQLPEPIPEGYIITDVTKKNYSIGPKIASGGFGTVYYASESSKKSFDYVVKVEHHANGPLFTEMHCYQNIGKPSQISDYIKKNKLPYLGLSPCYGTGSFEYNSSKYRFMIIERFGKDLQTLLEENGRVFASKTVYLVALSVLNTLEYMHSVGYIHGDIKAANLLLGTKKDTENQVYLVDLGLACKYKLNDIHKPNKPDLKKAHNGTPEFTSRDAHRGCITRRSDLEILCYNLLQWLTGELPWESFKTDNNKLQREKEKYMDNIENFLEVLFGNSACPVGIKRLLSYVNELDFEEDPDYKFCRKLLLDELKKLKCDKNDALEFKSLSKKPPIKNATTEGLANKENVKKPRKAPVKRKTDVSSLLDPGMIPTPAMLEQMKKIEEKESKPAKVRRK